MRLPVLDIRPAERSAVGWSFLYFLSLLCGYYVLRPVRDEMGIQAGVENLPWLFTTTFAVIVLAVPLFGWVTARWERRRALPAVYLFFIANLVAFHAAFQHEPLRIVAARAFFVWVSVFNLYAVSVFWSLMVDLYSEAQGRRLFGYIAAGGTAGALAGPAITAAAAPATGAVPLLLVSAVMLAICVLCIGRLSAWAAAMPGEAAAAPAAAGPAKSGAPLGGGVWDGLRAALASPYLLGICFYLFAYTVLSTLLYVETARLIGDHYAISAERTRLFAVLDLVVNGLTLSLQLLVTGPALRRLGVTLTLALLPAVAVIGFGVVAALPSLAVVLAFGVIRRAGEFALSKPAREVLFTVVPRDEKYKAKNFIDTVIYRGGDALSSWAAAGLRALGAGLSAIALVALPISLAWLAVAIWLGRREAQVRGNGGTD